MKIVLETIKMKERFEVLFDDEDILTLFNHRWHVAKRSRNGMYAVARTSSGRGVYMHQLILPAPQGKMVDHINGNGLDNRKCNLRLCIKIENQRNQRPRFGKRFKGVAFNARLMSKPWSAKIRVGYKNIHIGYFPTEIEAAIAYNSAAKEHFKEFAWFNEIPKELSDAV